MNWDMEYILTITTRVFRSLLRDAAHSFTTEAIANLFGRFATDPLWMNEHGID